MKVKINLFRYLVSCILIGTVYSKKLDDYFTNCHKSDPEFDECIKKALNDVRPLFKAGVPEYGVAPFDPFYATEVRQKRGGAMMNYKLLLRNVTESGWTVSRVTNFESELDNNMIRYTQFFPDKRLSGNYEITGSVFGNQFSNQGPWNLSLFDFVQTTTVTRKPRRTKNGTTFYDTPVKVDVDVETCKDLELHIGNLLRGRSVLENMLDQIINNAWQPGFVVFRPLINDLVSTAFSDIFTKNFQRFPFNEVIH